MVLFHTFSPSEIFGTKQSLKISDFFLIIGPFPLARWGGFLYNDKMREHCAGRFRQRQIDWKD